MLSFRLVAILSFMILHCQALRNARLDSRKEDSVKRVLQQPPSPSLRLALQLDQFPTETTVALLQGGTELDTRGPFETPAVEIDVVFEGLQFDVDYRLEVRDAFNDGICCAFGEGSFVGYAVYPNGSETMLFSGDGDFGNVSIHEFRIESSGGAPAVAPSATPPIGSPPTESSPTPGYPSCSICGEGMRISNPSVPIIVPSYGETTCQEFQDLGDDGFIEEVFCPVMVAYIAPCGCVSSSVDTPAPAPPSLSPPTFTPVPPSPNFPPCSVCGEGLRVSLPNTVITIPTFGNTTCAEFELAGDLGFIDEQFCPLIAGFAAPCGCVASSDTPTPAPPSLSPPTFTPVPPSPNFPPCSVCGEGLRVSLPNTVITIPTFGNTTCAEFELAGDLGFIDEQFCPLIVGFAAPCGCVASSDTPAPVLPVPAPAPATMAPVLPTIPPNPGHPPCNVCGEGMQISLPDAIVTIEGLDSYTCAEFAEAGELGFIGADICPEMPRLAEPCVCVSSDPAPDPACENDPSASFVVDALQGNRGCSFLENNPSYQYLCEFLDVAVACKQTCQVCFMFQ